MCKPALCVRAGQRTYLAALSQMQAVIPVGIAYPQVLDDLRAIIRHELSNAPAAPAVAAAPVDELLSISEAAALLGVTVQTVHEHKRRGLLKYHKLGSRSYIKRGDILSALEAHQRTAKAGKESRRA